MNFRALNICTRFPRVEDPTSRMRKYGRMTKKSTTFIQSCRNTDTLGEQTRRIANSNRNQTLMTSSTVPQASAWDSNARMVSIEAVKKCKNFFSYYATCQPVGPTYRPVRPYQKCYTREIVHLILGNSQNIDTKRK